jgi:hypothetical protein
LLKTAAPFAMVRLSRAMMRAHGSLTTDPINSHQRPVAGAGVPLSLVAQSRLWGDGRRDLWGRLRRRFRSLSQVTVPLVSPLSVATQSPAFYRNCSKRHPCKELRRGLSVAKNRLSVIRPSRQKSKEMLGRQSNWDVPKRLRVSDENQAPQKTITGADPCNS